MRVAHLISGDLWAGAEIATFHLLRALTARREVDVRAITFNQGTLAERLRDAGVPVTIEPEEGRGVWALSRAVSLHLAQADLVHAHRDKESLLAALSGRPWIATQHGRPETPSGLPRPWGLAKRILELSLKRYSARRVVAVSEEVAEWLRPRVGRARTVRIWNGIADPASDAPVPPFADRPPRVGVLCRLFPVKCVDLALDTIAVCPGLDLEIVGDGPDRPRLEAHAAARGLGARVRFVGHDPDPLPRVARWRALLVTSRHEGNPIGVLEAIGSGTPVVAPPLRGVSDILNGKGGRLAEDRRPESLAAALAAVALDAEAGATASRTARERYLEAFTADRASERMVALYREARSA